jgi:hypothetical protein
MLQAIKPEVDKVDQSLRESGVENEWRSLYHALEFLPTTVQDPYETLGLLSSSLQAAGVGALCMMIQYSDLRSVPGALLCTGLVISTSYVLWLKYWMRGYFGVLASCQIAAMIQQSRETRESK